MSLFREQQFIIDPKAEIHLLHDTCKCLKLESVTGASVKRRVAWRGAAVPKHKLWLENYSVLQWQV